MQDETRNPGEDAQADPNNGTPEEDNTTFEDRPYLINVIQQNAVIVTGRKLKGDQSESDKSNSERWL